MRTTRWLEALRRLDVGLTLVLLAALALRLSWLAFVIRGGAIENGAVDGVAIAELLIKGSGIDAAPADVARATPFFPALMASGKVLAAGAISMSAAGRLISAVFGALLVIPVFYLARSSSGRTPALIAAWAVALHPLLVTASTTLLALSTYLTLLFAGAWYALVAMQSRRLAVAAIAGVLFALATLTRSEGLVFVAAVLIATVDMAGRSRQKLRVPAVCFVTCGAVLLPYALFLMGTGAWTPITASPVDAGRTLSGISAASQAVCSPVLLALAAFGLRRTRDVSIPGIQQLLLALAVTGLLAVGINWGHGQMVIVVLPILLIWAAAGVANLSASFANAFVTPRVLTARFRSAVSVFLLLGMVVVSSRHVDAIPALAETGPFGQKIRLASRWLTWVDRGGNRVMDSSPNLALHAGASFVPLPPGDGPAALAAIEAAGVDFIVVRSSGVASRAYLRDWLERGIPDRRARLVYSDQAHTDQRVVIYRWTEHGDHIGQRAFARKPARGVLAESGTRAPRAPLKVSSENPRYFSDGSGRVVYLTGFHTWSNLQDADRADPPARFDFERYLSYLEDYDHNFIRLWTAEQANWVPWRPYGFRIEPTPFLRSGPGVALDGGAKFDVRRFNDAYFQRLRERVRAAGQRGMYVSVMLFNGWSVERKGQRWEDPWQGHPLHRDNNVNGLDGDPRRTGTGTGVHALSDPRIREAQAAYVTKVVDTLNDFNNVLFEICNECHDGSVEWQYHMIRFIKALESKRPKKHPVGMTGIYPTGRHVDLEQSPADWISPNINAGYETDPPAANGKKVIISDTDHLFGLGGDRAWVWKSFTRGVNPVFMDGYDYAWQYPEGGNGDDSRWEDVRRNLRYTSAYARRADLTTMTPRGELSSTVFCLARTEGDRHAYLAYSPDGGPVTLDLTASRGSLNVEWFDPKRGLRLPAASVAGGSKQTFRSPFDGDAVLYVANRSAWSTRP